MPKSIQIAHDFGTGAKAQNEAWDGQDFAVDDLGKFRCNIAIGEEKRIQYTVNGGNDWLLLNGGTALKANCGYGFDILTRAGDNFNFRCPDNGGCTVIMARTDWVKDEG